MTTNADIYMKPFIPTNNAVRQNNGHQEKARGFESRYESSGAEKADTKGSVSSSTDRQPVQHGGETTRNTEATDDTKSFKSHLDNETSPKEPHYSDSKPYGHKDSPASQGQPVTSPKAAHIDAGEENQGSTPPVNNEIISAAIASTLGLSQQPAIPVATPATVEPQNTASALKSGSQEKISSINPVAPEQNNSPDTGKNITPQNIPASSAAANSQPTLTAPQQPVKSPVPTGQTEAGKQSTPAPAVVNDSPVRPVAAENSQEQTLNNAPQTNPVSVASSQNQTQTPVEKQSESIPATPLSEASLPTKGRQTSPSAMEPAQAKQPLSQNAAAPLHVAQLHKSETASHAEPAPQANVQNHTAQNMTSALPLTLQTPPVKNSIDFPHNMPFTNGLIKQTVAQSIKASGSAEGANMAAQVSKGNKGTNTAQASGQTKAGNVLANQSAGQNSNTQGSAQKETTLGSLLQSMNKSSPAAPPQAVPLAQEGGSLMSQNPNGPVANGLAHTGILPTQHASPQAVATTSALFSQEAPRVAPQMVTQQISMAIAKNSASGQDSFTIKLSPEDLGQVEIKMTFQSDGKIQAVLMVENDKTLSLMQKDQAALEKALQNAGFDTNGDSLSFSLKQQQQEAHKNQLAGNEQDNSDDEDTPFDAENPLNNPQQIRMRYSSNALDINV